MTSNAREAVIVSVARTPIAKAYRGAFNDLTSPSLAAIAINAALDKVNISGDEVDDCILVPLCSRVAKV